MLAFLALSFLLLLLSGTHVHARAKDQMCSGWGSWQHGNTYGQMNVERYSMSHKDCALSLSPIALKYAPGQEFALTVTPSSKMGIKVVVLGGARFLTQGLSMGGQISTEEDYCVNYDMPTLSAEMKFRAPDSRGGALTVLALCGTKKVMHISNEITLEPNRDVQPVLVQFSTDGAYAFEQSLHHQVLLRYYRNATHLDLAMEFAKHGYVSLGIGRMMVPSIALIGADPASNPEMANGNAVALHRIINKQTKGTGSMLTKEPLLDSAGLVDYSFSQLASGKSVLKFTQELAKANSFSLTGGEVVEEEDEGMDLIWAVGPSKYGRHTLAGTLLKMKFIVGEGGKVEPSPRPTLAPTQPTSLAPTQQATFAPTRNATGIDGDGGAEETLPNEDNSTMMEDGKEEMSGDADGFFFGVLLVFGALVSVASGAVVVAKRQCNARGPERKLRQFMHAFRRDHNDDDEEIGGGLNYVPVDRTSNAPQVSMLDGAATATSFQTSPESLELSLLSSTPFSLPVYSSQDRVVISRQEFADSPNLTLYKGKVYDFTDFLDVHPGGREIILAAGKDITLEFNEQGHSKAAHRLLESYLAGVLEG